MARHTSDTTNHHTLSQKIAFAKYVESWYSKLNLHDSEFASDAEKALGFKVTTGNVQGMRGALGIPSTRAVKREETAKTLEGRVAALELRLAALEAIAK